MGYTFNPFTSNFDNYGDGGSWKDPVSTYSVLPVVGNTNGDARVTVDTQDVYVWRSSDSTWVLATGVTIGAFSTSATASGLSVTTDSSLQLHAADASNPGAVSTGTQSFAGNKTFTGSVTATGLITANGGVDATTLALGPAATTVNVGNSTATVNIYGTTNNITSTNMNVSNNRIELNTGGGAGTGASSGIDIQEASAVTGYVRVDGTRNSWLMKAPGQTGIVTLSPGASGISINQNLTTTSSPTFSGLTLSAMSTAGVVHNNGSGVLASSLVVDADVSSSAAISLSKLAALTPSVVPQLDATGHLSASAVSNTALGYIANLTSDAQTQINGKQPVGNYITALTGDVTATGPGSVGATVNSVGGSSAALVHSAELAANAATSANTPSKIVARDASGNFSAGTITATSLTGNLVGSTLETLASPPSSTTTGRLYFDTTASQLRIYNGTTYGTYVDTSSIQTLTNKNLTGNLAQTLGNGTAQLTLPNGPADTLVTLTYLQTLTNKTISGASNTLTNIPNSATTATSANTASAIVARDGSGNFSAGTITATLNGNASGNVVVGPGDIAPSSFALANNQSAATSVTGLAFANASVHYAEVAYSIQIAATSSLFEGGTLRLVQKGSSWDMSQSYVGDNTGITFTVTAAGQVQYTSPSFAGFSSATLRFSARTL